MSELIVRCSSIGRLMAEPLNADIDPEYMTAELQDIIGRTKRSESEKALLGEARRKSLSAGGKTHVRELLREAIYGFEPADIETRPILKGRQMERAGIEMLARLTGRPLVKNTVRRNNGLLSGECDVFDAPIRLGSDAKLPYSMATMPIVLADCYDSGYEYQMRGYMSDGMWDADRWSVDYLLLSTPEELIGYEPPSLHYVDHIPEHLRWTRWMVQRDRAIESLIVDKVLAARRYYRQAMNDFDRTHALPGASPAEDLTAPPWSGPPPQPPPPTWRRAFEGTMSNENAPEIESARPAVGGPVERMVRPRAFLCEYVYRGSVRHELSEELPTHDGVESAMMEPLYGRSALDGAVIKERERCLYWCGLGASDGYAAHHIEAGTMPPDGPNAANNRPA